MKLSSGPLQGFTDDVFRFVHSQVYGGIDTYYGPYIRLESHKSPKSSQVRDITSALNKSIHFIPQILSNDPTSIIEQINKLQELGIEQINWNLGCPYPMVTKRGMGSGLLNQAEVVKNILSQIFSETEVKLSIKCRLGMESEQDILTLIEVFNQFNLNEIIVHARTAKQMYKGNAQPEKIIPLIEESKHPIAYNGDICSVEDFNVLNALFNGKIDHFMIGRGLISNPGLGMEIKGLEIDSNSFIKFHDSLIEKYLKRYQEHQLLKKMQGFWEYFGIQFPEKKKVLKRIKKSRKWSQYIEFTNQLFNQA